MKTKFFTKTSLFLFGICISNVTYAGITSWVTVTHVGGQGGSMGISVSEPVGADIGCPHTKINFPTNALHPDDQKRLYAAALVAMSSDKEMQFFLSKCSNGYPYWDGGTGYWSLKK